MIKFLEAEHIYLVDGIIVPSVSTILGATIFKDKYANVPSYILNAKRDFGTNVHKAIETSMSEYLTYEELLSYEDYERLVREHNIEPVEHEQIVHYDLLYAGTFDMIALWGELQSLGDVKTTYRLDVEYLSWQLTMYEMAYCHLYGVDRFEKLFAIWLPKNRSGKVVEIERKTDEEVMALVKQYHDMQEPLPDF